MAERRGTIAILAKAPIPGYAKTRLIPRLGPDGAAALHAVLLERTLRAALAGGFASVALWCAPGKDAAAFAAMASTPALELLDQPDGDLGARMLAAFRAHLPRHGPVVLAGTDCPELTPERLRELREALQVGADAALLPTRDGGYAAIGLARVDPSVFEGMPWGTSDVLARTRARLDALGWRRHELEPVRDVDRPEDVAWLMSTELLGADDRARIARSLLFLGPGGGSP